MQKILTSIFSLLLLNTSFATDIKSKKDLRKMIRADEGVITTLRGFVKAGLPLRMMGRDSHESARKFLIDHIKKVDKDHPKNLSIQEFKPEISEAIKLNDQDFEKKIASLYTQTSREYKSFKAKINNLNLRFKEFEKIPGYNILWEKKGTSDESKIVITAHYDSVLIDTKSLRIITNKKAPGADYNASGVAIALKIIELASKLNLKNTIQVALLDYQGVGFLGSYHLAKSLDKDKVKGIVNLEMLGHDSKVFDKKKKSGNMKAYGRKSTDPESKKDKALYELINFGRKISSSVRFDLELNGFDQSDHFRFWDQGIPAITFSQNWEDDFNDKRYQSSNDIVEGINVKTYRNATEYLLGGVLAFALDLKK